MPGPYAYQEALLRTSISTAITVVQIKAGAAASFEVSDILSTMDGSTTSAQPAIELVRKTAAASVTSQALIQRNTGDPVPKALASSSQSGVNAAAEGTDGDVLEVWGFNVLNGIGWVYIPELRVHVAAAGIIALKFPAAPAANTFSVKLGILENQ